MATVKFVPNDTAPSDAERTVYNVFVDNVFAGYIYKDWMEYWWYMVDGKEATGGGNSDRQTLFDFVIKINA